MLQPVQPRRGTRPPGAASGRACRQRRSCHVGGGFTRHRRAAAQLHRSAGCCQWCRHVLEPERERWCRRLWPFCGAKVYAGGTFGSVGGQPRSGIAALDATSGAATSWNLERANSGVYAYWPSTGAKVYAGGTFGSMGGQPRSGIAALDADQWRRHVLETRTQMAGVYAYGRLRGKVYAGGTFGSIGGQPRNGIAALDADHRRRHRLEPDRGRRRQRPCRQGEQSTPAAASPASAGSRATTSPRSMRPAAPPPPGTRTRTARSWPLR